MPALHERRASYPHFLAVPTRAEDANAYGMMASPFFYACFERVISDYLIRQGALDVDNGPVTVNCFESHCRFHRPVVHPQTLAVGLRVAPLGTSSVRYEIGLFRDDEDKPVAQGFHVQVFMDRGKNKPAAIPGEIRASLEKLILGPGR